MRTRSKYYGPPGWSLTVSVDSGRYQNNMDSAAVSPQIDLLPLAAAMYLIVRPAWLFSVAVLTASALLVYSRRRKEEI